MWVEGKGWVNLNLCFNVNLGQARPLFAWILALFGVLARTDEVGIC